MKDVSATFQQIRNVPGTIDTQRTPASAKGPRDNAFADQLQALQNAMPTQAPVKPGQVSGLKFSNHAVDRMQMRGLSFSPEQMAKIESAVGKAEAKGAKNTLLLTDAAAMIVSIKDKTVVTVMDKANLKENVFTNIDSTVMI